MTDLKIDASGTGRRERTDDPAPKMRHRWQRLKGSHTLAEMLDWADAQGLDYGAVSVPWVTMHWESPETPETPEEVADRVAWQEQQAARHAEWERETYARLRAKYGPPEHPHPLDRPSTAAATVAVNRADLIALRHMEHYRGCNCLAESAVCCDAQCPCSKAGR